MASSTKLKLVWLYAAAFICATYPAFAVSIGGVDVEDIGIQNTSWRLEPSYKFKEDSLGRESWELKQSARAALFKHYGVIAGYQHAAYKERGVESVNDNAALLGFDAETEQKDHFFETIFTLHNFSDDIGIPFSFKSEWRSQWTTWLRSHFRVGRDPYPTASALHKGIKETFFESNLFVRPVKPVEFRWLSKTEFITDKNRIYTQEAEADIRIPKLNFIQAIYLFTLENSSNQTEDYYTPNRTRQHQFGGDIYLEKENLGYIYSRYLCGFGSAAWNDSGWTIHTVDVSAGINATKNLTIGPSFAWGRTPTYESKTYSIFGRIEF